MLHVLQTLLEDLECLEIFSGFGCAVAKAFRDKKMHSNPVSL